MSLIASVTLNLVYLSDPTNPSVIVQCGTSGSIGGGGNRSDTITQEGSFRNYANFRTRLILGTSSTRADVLTLRALTPAQVTNVINWVGRVVLFRDTYGRRIFCSYLQPAITDIPLSGGLADVSLTLVQVYYNEATGAT